VGEKESPTDEVITSNSPLNLRYNLWV